MLRQAEASVRDPLGHLVLSAHLGKEHALAGDAYGFGRYIEQAHNFLEGIDGGDHRGFFSRTGWFAPVGGPGWLEGMRTAAGCSSAATTSSSPSSPR